ncbi:MAG: formate dehydrogenase [Burkholderiaceae bacterium]|nr:MAG: formate dehydrogenase [Burkholderiaceae bacterium]
MQDRQPNPSSRRGFFAGAATLGAAAAAVAVLPRVEGEPAVAQESPRPAPERGGGYHLSAHVRQYYKTTQL